MRFSRIILIIAVILAIFILWKSLTPKNETPVQNSGAQEQNVSENQKKEPNALDVMAPYYNKTQKQVKSIQEMRQQTIQEERELLKEDNN